MDKRYTQISLPLNLPERELKDNIKQHWNITFARQGKMSVIAKRMMALILAQIHDNDNRLKPFFELHATDVIIGSSDSGKVYKDIQQAFRDLASAVWIIEDLDLRKFEPRNLLDTTKTEKKDGFKTAYNDGRITIALNPALEDYFIALSHYTRYELKHYMKFKSWYSMRLWEILSAFRDTRQWNVSIAEYRKLMDCEKKYLKSPNLLVENTTAEALEELKNTDLEFTVEKIFGRVPGVKKPKIVALEFKLVKEVASDLERLRIFSNPKNTHPDHEALAIDLHQTWKIPVNSLIKYLPAIGMGKAKEIRRQFQMMESIGSKRKIDNRERYCTSVLKKAANSIIESNIPIKKS